LSLGRADGGYVGRPPTLIVEDVAEGFHAFARERSQEPCPIIRSVATRGWQASSPSNGNGLPGNSFSTWPAGRQPASSDGSDRVSEKPRTVIAAGHGRAYGPGARGCLADGTASRPVTALIGQVRNRGRLSRRGMGGPMARVPMPSSMTKPSDYGIELASAPTIGGDPERLRRQQCGVVRIAQQHDSQGASPGTDRVE